MFEFLKKKKKDKPKLNLEKKSELGRGFAAARATNANFGWTRRSVTIDSDIYMDLESLRARARELENDSGIFEHFLILIENNVIGSGFKLQSLGKDYPDNKLDVTANTAIERAFKDWCKAKHCDIYGKSNFNTLCFSIMRGLARDGEALIRLVSGPSSDDDKYGFQIQCLDIDRLDIQYNADLNNGNYIRMGVEINQRGKPVAYHLKAYTNKSIDYASGTYTSNYERVPANEIIHLFKQKHAEQTRGIPWGHAVFEDIKDFQEFDQACLNAGKIGASSSIYLERGQGVTTQQIADQQDPETGQFLQYIGVGEIRSLPAGTTLKTFDGKYPSDAYQIYTKRLLQKIAGGLGLSQIFLGNDTEDLNYSTARTIIVEERSFYKNLQNFFSESCLEKIYEQFLKQALLNRTIKINQFSTLPAEAYNKFMSYKFVGRSWEWVDPLKETESTLLQFRNGMKPLSQILDEQGLNLGEVMTQYKRDSDIIKQNLGVELSFDAFFKAMLEGAGSDK